MKAKEKDKLAKFDARGIQTLFRTLLRNHYGLLRMVDTKSSIIITINSIIISLLMGTLFLAPESKVSIIEIGVRVLMKFCFASMIIALISMLPHRYRGKGYHKDAYKGVLYADSFSKLPIERYKIEMQRVMAKGNAVYNEMICDLYYLGKSIAVKQKLVLYSFLVFITGIVFIVSYLAYHGI